MKMKGFPQQFKTFIKYDKKNFKSISQLLPFLEQKNTVIMSTPSLQRGVEIKNIISVIDVGLRYFNEEYPQSFFQKLLLKPIDF